MATERLEVRQIREILRQRAQGRSVREVACSLGVSVGSVQKTAARATRAGLTWAAAEALDERTLDERLYGRPRSRAMNDAGSSAYLRTQR